MAPEVREKSGVWYRLNRWREELDVPKDYASWVKARAKRKEKSGVEVR
jgi:hypothetical protein